mmetsp:Transcript_10316/g.28999  ORF Transcript_10316/g.28999 Transcript_10316/m.28999 type:complete len:208 (+) Transcript_10316:1557-2180(+)
MCLTLGVFGVPLQSLPFGGGRDERQSLFSISRYYVLEDRGEPHLRTPASSSFVSIESFCSVGGTGVFQVMLSLNGPRNSDLRRRLVMELTLMSISMVLLPMSRQALVMMQAFFNDVHPWPGWRRHTLVNRLLIRRSRYHHLRPLRSHRPTWVAESPSLPRSMRFAQLARLAGRSILLLCHEQWSSAIISVALSLSAFVAHLMYPYSF